MVQPTCSNQSIALICQILLILTSFGFALATIIKIIQQKLYKNPFTFLIMVIQSCYAMMATIDLLTKAAAQFNIHMTWCQILSPFIYGAIMSSFLLMQLFVLMIYLTLQKKRYGCINHNIRIISIGIIVGAICLNCCAVSYFTLGFCESCVFANLDLKGYYTFAGVIIGANYYIPTILVIPSIFFLYSLMKKKTCKVLWIPFINFIVLLISSVAGYMPTMPAIAFVFVFDSIYYVAIINFIFYFCFVSFFQFDNTQSSSSCLCLKDSKNDSMYDSELYPYRTSST